MSILLMKISLFTIYNFLPQLQDLGGSATIPNNAKMLTSIQCIAEVTCVNNKGYTEMIDYRLHGKDE